jgi:hypothetical protein
MRSGHDGVPRIEGADLDDAGAVFYGDFVVAVVEDGIAFAGGPPGPGGLGQLAGAKAEGEFVADGKE